MLKIRKEQNEVLSEYMIQQFIDRVATHLRSEYAEETKSLSNEELKTLIKNGMNKAEKYNVELEDDIQDYIDYMVIYGTDFDVNPSLNWSHEILRRPGLDGSEKMDEINKQHAFLLRERG